jgi:hypothetical protein
MLDEVTTRGQLAARKIADDLSYGLGVHGYVEEAIVRMERLARLFARGNDHDYIAMMALEDFAGAGHATLAKDMSTYVVTLA